MKNFLKYGVVVLTLLFASCNNAETPNSPTAVPDKVLVPSGTQDENMFKATGEVVIFFQPSREKIMAWEGDKGALQTSMQAYTAAVESAQKSLTEMGISSYTTDKSDVKINISEQKFFVVNAGASKDGFGFIMTKLGNDPKVSLGAFTPEQVVEQAKAFYKK